MNAHPAFASVTVVLAEARAVLVRVTVLSQRRAVLTTTVKAATDR
jgi:hypothetical protein